LTLVHRPLALQLRSQPIHRLGLALERRGGRGCRPEPPVVVHDHGPRRSADRLSPDGRQDDRILVGIGADSDLPRLPAKLELAMSMLFVPVVSFWPASVPIAMFELPVVFPSSAR
jgi:hypothetical protein